MTAHPAPTTAVNPTPESVAALTALTDDDPLLMVNLMHYRDGDSALYNRYTSVAGGTVRAREGGPVFTGPTVEGTTGDDHWDHVTLVYYPRRAAYLDMQNDPAYLGAIPDRTAGLERRLLYATHEARVPGSHPPSDEPVKVERSSPDEIFVFNLLRFTADGGRETYEAHGLETAELMRQCGAEPVLAATGQLAMVSDDRWDELLLVRYPSMKALSDLVTSGAWQALHAEWPAGLDASLPLVCH